MLDYYEIGQRIRKYRKAHGFSQEELAEKVGISTTHMSHIETGNTKLSLPVLVDLASVLEVRTDDLLNTSGESPFSAAEEISALLEGCSDRQSKALIDIVKAVKLSIDKHLS